MWTSGKSGMLKTWNTFRDIARQTFPGRCSSVVKLWEHCGQFCRFKPSPGQCDKEMTCTEGILILSCLYPFKHFWITYAPRSAISWQPLPNDLTPPTNKNADVLSRQQYYTCHLNILQHSHDCIIDKVCSNNMTQIQFSIKKPSQKCFIWRFTWYH